MMTGLVTLGRNRNCSAATGGYRLPCRPRPAPDGLVQDELPKYLLAPEVSALLHYVPDLHRKMLLATLWNTGARINEALALTRGIFRWHRRIRSCSWPRSNSVRKKRPERPAERPPAIRPIVWFRYPITSTSASCR
jgi:integrase